MSDGRPSEWLNDLRSGDADSARRIFEHFSQRLCRLAQRHLSARVRPRVDEEDVVQSVFRTFFQRDAQGLFQVDHSDELWRLLVTITVRKARGIWRKNSSAARDVGREVHLDDSDPAQITAFAHEPSVVEALVLADEIETVLEGLPESSARALELRMGGYSPTEAAELMGLSRQAFYRLLEPIKERLLKRDSTLAGASNNDGPLSGSDLS